MFLPSLSLVLLYAHFRWTGAILFSYCTNKKFRSSLIPTSQLWFQSLEGSHFCLFSSILRVPCVCVCCAKSLQLCLTLCYAMDQSPPGSSIQGFSRQEYWSGLPCPSTGDLPDPGIVSTSLMSPVLAGRFFITSTTWEVFSQAFALMKKAPLARTCRQPPTNSPERT